MKPTFKLKLFAYLLAYLLLFSLSCRKDTITPGKGPNELTIAEAKSFFEANLGKPISLKGIVMSTQSNSSTLSPVEMIFANKQPLWDKAYQKMISIGGAVKIPMDMGPSYAIVNKNTNAVVPFASLNYLLMYKDSLQNVHAEWVMLAPDSAWLYGNRDHYTGRIIVRNWLGKKIRDINYNGTLVSTSSTAGIKHSQLKIASINEPATNSESAPGSPYCIKVKNQATCNCQAAWSNHYTVWDPSKCDGCSHCTYLDCIWPLDCANCDDPTPPGGNGGSGGTGPGGGGLGGGGSTGGGDYPPNCESDPNYVMPTTPPPPGTQWMLPCGSVPIPVVPGDNPTPTPVALNAPDYLIQKLEILPSETSLLEYIQDVAHTSIINEMRAYIISSGATQESIDFVRWQVEYLVANPSLSYEDFKSQFLGDTEAEELDDYDANYWNDPNLVIATQTLPSFFAFSLAYPISGLGSTTFELPAPAMFDLVGGPIKALRDATLTDNDPTNNGRYSNACALRVSRALNYSGVTIPEVSGTYKGGDGMNYFLSAASLNAWMIKAFPPTSTNSINLTSADAGAHGSGFANALKNQKGIYIMIPNFPGNNYFGASGHAGLFTTPPVTHYYFSAKGGIDKITLWKLN